MSDIRMADLGMRHCFRYEDFEMLPNHDGGNALLFDADFKK